MPAFQAPQRKQQDITHPQAYTGTKAAPVTTGDDSMHLQRTLGNRAVGDMLNLQAKSEGVGVPGFPGLAVQAKMTVRPAGDQFEQEADQMAKTVVDGIQREESGELEEEELQMKSASEGIQREESGELEEEELQMKSDGDGFDAAPSVEQEIQAKKGSGGKMDADIQAKMESAFEKDFSSVNIHTDGQSDELNRSIGAKAFTTGNDIFFRQGEYNPGSREGQELLGHELTHVVQQKNGRV